MSTTPKPPSRALAFAAAATGILAALLCAGAFITFGLRWSDRMNGSEIRLALIALAVAMVRHALWSFHVRQRGLYEQAVEAARYDRRLTDMEQRLGYLDEGMASIAGRTQRLANCLETIEVDGETAGPGEDTCDLIRLPKPRRLRPVPGPKSN